MKKATSNDQSTWKFPARLPATLSTFVLGLLCCIPITRASAQTCIRCPDNANDTAIGTAFGVFAHRNGVDVNVSGQTVGSCEQLILKANVSYNAFGISGGIGAGFTGGNGRIIFPGGSSVDVTPADMATTLVGPAPCGTTPVKLMSNAVYTITSADIAAGSATFTFQFTNGTSLLPNAQNQCVLKVSASPQQSVSIAPRPTCTVTPPNNVCPGSSASFTVNPTGTGPFTFSWTGPAGFTSTNQTITIPSAAAANGGYYVATVFDQFGCSSTCSNLLTVYTNPVVTIAPTNVCVGSPACLIASPTTFGSTVASYSWTKVGSSTVLSTTSQLCFNNPQLSDAGTYQVILTDSHGCSGTNTGTLTVRPNPTCNLTGPADVCELTTNTYSSTVDPTGGTVTHSWAFVGAHPNASFVGSTTGPTVQVAAGAAITSRDCFTLTDTVTRDNCPGACTNTFCIIPCRPALKVYKQVVCYSNACEPFNADLTTQKSAFGVRTDNPLNCPAFCYRITVTNAGDVPLTNLQITDSSIPGPNLNLATCPFPTTLPVGGWTNCIVPAFTRCSNDVNIVTATASGQNGAGTTTTLVSQDTNTVTVVPISIACGIYIRTNGGTAFIKYDSCPSQALGDSYTVRIGVTNTGQYALQNVMAANLSGFGSCFGTTNLGTLAIGAVALIDCQNSCTTVSSNYYAVSVSGEASQAAAHVCAFTAQGQPITTSSQCSTCVLCVGAPAIKVWKQVVCYSNICEPFNANLDTQKTATGVRIDPANDADCPAFCYRITVTNLGNVTLSNLVVVDANSSDGKVLNLAGCGFPSTLAPAGQPGSSAFCIVTTNHCFNSTNIVTATAVGQTSIGGTSTVSSTDTNRVTVNPISVACRLLVSTDNGATFGEYHTPNCATQLITQPYIIRVVVTNTGSYGLQNVVVTDTAGTLGVCLATPRTITSLAVGGTSSFDCTNTCVVGGVINYAVSVSAVASQAQGHICDYNIAGVEIKAQSSCDTCVRCVGQPAIKVWKQVVCYSNICEPFSANLDTQKTAAGVRIDPANDADCPAFCYRITVTNLGNVTLSNVTVVDANITDGKTLNLSNCGFPSTLAPAGQPGSGFSCTVTTNHCVNSTNIVTATGLGLDSTGGTSTVSSTDTNRVTVTPISVACTILISTNNGASFVSPASSGCSEFILGTTYMVRVVVTNTGSYALQNVVLTGTGVCFATTNIGGLAIGESKVVDCAGIVCRSVSTNNYSVSVSAEVSQSQGHVCDHNIAGQQIKATSSCNACVICQGTPCIKVFKGIACVICTTNGSGGVSLACASATGGFEKEAFGVRSDTQDPAFCYQIMVTNCGSLSLNVTLTDAKLGLNNIPIGVLAPNQSFTTNLVQDWHVTTTNIVIANGIVAGTGASVSDTNFAIAHVRPASIACVKTVSVNGGPFQHSIQLTNEIVTNISWAVTITNTGQADLENVTITDLSQNDDLPCNINMVVPGIFPVGGSVGPIIVCSNNTGFTSCTNLSIDNDIRVVATAAAEGTNCVWDINGTNIMVQTSCDAHLDLFCVVPNACRVTGGGRQDSPDICPADVRYVTHGGQVGAPVGNKVCTIDTSIPNYFLGNPCIHGRWTHVRHVKGGLEGNFHARFFDTLDCACLDTTYDPQTCRYGPETVVHGICGDRSTGPLPRPAGANKIAFTGVGDWACPNGRREGRSCLFRVDIEDRGEPGNAHALASNGKQNRVPDRYRIRIWVLSDAEIAQLNGAGPDPYLLNFRNAISACNGLEYRDGGIIGQCDAPNNCISTDSCTSGGPASPSIMFPGGAPVRRPNIDDGGEMLHGNHQIHPAIKNCDPFNPTGPGLAKP